MRTFFMSGLFCSLFALALCRADEAKVWKLIDGTTMADWEMVDMGGSGEVEWDKEDKAMIIRQGEMVSGAVYKKAAELPVIDYEITLEAKRLMGVDFFCGLTFPVGDLDTCATLILGGWGGSVTGISCIDGADAANNATATYQRYEDDHYYAVRLRVTAKNLSVWLDEEQVVDQDIEGRQVSLRAGSIESYVPLSLTTFNTTGAIRNMVIKKIEAE